MQVQLIERTYLTSFNQEFQHLHGDGDFDWRTLRLITHDASLGKHKYSEAPGDAWALPLLVGGNNTVGQPLSLHESFDVKRGDIYFGFRIKRT